MRTLWLHIGHGKTGSSFLQSCFASSRPLLRTQGIDYPWHKGIARAARGQTTSGNGRILMRAMDSRPHRGLFIARARLTSHDWLLSSEFLFHRLSRDNAIAKIRSVSQAAGFDQLRMLLLIRDPETHLVSAWRQWVKAHGFTGTIDDALRQYRVPMIAERVIERFASAAGISLTVRNYDRVADDISFTAEAFLGLSGPTSLRGPSKPVNATRAAFDLPADTRRRLWKKVGPSVARINRMLPEADRYRIPADIIQTW